MKQTYLDTPDDIAWLMTTALRPDNVDDEAHGLMLALGVEEGFTPQAAVIFGNEDAPDEIHLYSQERPTISDEYVRFTRRLCTGVFTAEMVYPQEHVQ